MRPLKFSVRRKFPIGMVFNILVPALSLFGYLRAHFNVKQTPVMGYKSIMMIRAAIARP
jgi:hypothetical protein